MPTISIPQNLKNRLDKRKALKQPYSGLIEELLNLEKRQNDFNGVEA